MKELSSKSRTMSVSAIITIYLLLIIEYCSTLQGNITKLLRIYRGKNAQPGQYPYVVALSTSEELGTPWILGQKLHRSCTGSLISPVWVLTASHCISSRITRIRYGNMTTAPNSPEATYSPVRRSIAHHNYKMHQLSQRYKNILSMINDIGLLLVELVQLPTYGRLSAVEYTTMIGYPVTYVGMGKTIKGGTSNYTYKRYKDEIRVAQVGQAVVKSCHKRDNGVIGPSICTAPLCTKKYQKLLPGDSGGPVIHAQMIVGVACCTLSREKEMRFTAVSPFLNWIVDVMTKTQ